MPDDAAGRARHGDLAAQSVKTAEMARSIAGALSPDLADEVFFAGLLHRGCDWLAALDTSCPAWLEGILAATRQPAEREPTTAGGFVALALAILNGSEQPLPKLRVHRRGIDKKAAAAAERWLAPSHRAGDWLATLAARLEQLGQLQSEFDVKLEREKLESLAEFAAAAGHEMNNPLAVISGRAQLFLRTEQDPQRRRELALINSQTLRVHEMIADLMLFARPPRPRPESLDLGELLAGVVRDLGPAAAGQDTTLSLKASNAPLQIRADRAQLMVVLRAMCENSLAAVGSGGRIEVAARAVELRSQPNNGAPGAPQEVQITVSDDGPGISDEVRRHLFDPFYSGRAAGRGLGLGLSKCWRIATEHGGRIEVASALEQGTTLTITLPVAGPP